MSNPADRYDAITAVEDLGIEHVLEADHTEINRD